METPDGEARPAPFIYINGYAGVGKLSIARCLVHLLPQPAKLLDNHLLIDPVSAILDRTSSEYQPLRKSVRSTILSAIVSSADLRNTTMIFTDQQSSDALGSSVAREYEDAARRRGCQFLSFRLFCSLEENLRRATSEGRMKSGTTKLTDANIIKIIRTSEDTFSFGGDDEFTLDVTELSVEAAAQQIAELVRKRVSLHASIAMEQVT